jgi:hypothetical protein
MPKKMIKKFNQKNSNRVTVYSNRGNSKLSVKVKSTTYDNRNT